ncbi:hypothetical protein HK405_013730 [Cladochytrium tenue]|nr:hypothetical protein HK405_013730 [Cladochytrium tenue]
MRPIIPSAAVAAVVAAPRRAFAAPAAAATALRPRAFTVSAPAAAGGHGHAAPSFDPKLPVASVQVDWIAQSESQFEGSDPHGNRVLMSGSDEPGTGPMKLLLMGLGACAAIDVVSILRKQRQPFQSVRVNVDGQRPAAGDTAHPARPYSAIHATFLVAGEGLDQAKVDRAVGLSIEKYCGVHATLLEGVPSMTWTAELVPPEKK